MKCPSCDYVIKDKNLICLKCGFDLQSLPTYAPVEESLEEDVFIDDRYATRPVPSGGALKKANLRKHTSTRILNQEERRRIRLAEEERRAAFVEVERVLLREERAGTYQLTPKKAAIKRKRRKRALISLLAVLLVVIGVGLIINHNSYRGIVNRGNQALGGGNLHEAESLFRRAIDRSPHRYEGIVGLSRIYLQNNQLSEAEGVLLGALDGQVTNIPLYEAIIEFYLETGQYLKVSLLLDGADSRVLEVFEEYVSPAPLFSLEEGFFEEVQEVSISSEIPGVIHYTVDGREPTPSSPVYRESILLVEGEHTISAILVNQRGIPSLTTTRNYTIQLPITDAPAVTPSTGVYNVPTWIVIHVPEGYTAYFTLDGSIPTTLSYLYEGPIDMEEGNTLFTAILVNNLSGRMTEPTVRNFTLE
jgi:tetratricopeptide (TPR) repeat protein